MSIPAGAAVVIAGQGELLVHLEYFAQKPGYRRPFTVASSAADRDVDACLPQ